MNSVLRGGNTVARRSTNIEYTLRLKEETEYGGAKLNDELFKEHFLEISTLFCPELELSQLLCIVGGGYSKIKDTVCGKFSVQQWYSTLSTV